MVDWLIVGMRRKAIGYSHLEAHPPDLHNNAAAKLRRMYLCLEQGAAPAVGTNGIPRDPVRNAVDVEGVSTGEC